MPDLPKLHRLVEQHVSPAAMTAIVRGVNTAYRRAWEQCQENLEGPLRNQAWGYYRWLQVDSELLGVGERHAERADFLPNTDQTHIGHAELHFGPVFLTAACVSNRGDLPNFAAYRQSLAEANQLRIWEETRQAQDGRTWAVLLHVPDASQHTPRHVDLGFIDRDGKFACPLMNLLDRVERLTPTVRRIEPTVIVRPKLGNG